MDRRRKEILHRKSEMSFEKEEINEMMEEMKRKINGAVFKKAIKSKK